MFASSEEQSTWNWQRALEEIEDEIKRPKVERPKVERPKVERPPIFQVFPNESTAMEHDVAIQRARLVGHVVGIGAAVLTLLLDSKSGLR